MECKVSSVKCEVWCRGVEVECEVLSVESKV